MIDVKYLEKEINNLKAQREQFLASANAALGAIQAYEVLIEKIKSGKLEKEEIENDSTIT